MYAIVLVFVRSGFVKINKVTKCVADCSPCSHHSQRVRLHWRYHRLQLEVSHSQIISERKISFL